MCIAHSSEWPYEQPVCDAVWNLILDAADERANPGAETTIHALAREALASRDDYLAKGYVMAPLPHESEVRAALRR